MAWIWGDGAWLHLNTQAMRLGSEVPGWLADNNWLHPLIGLAALVLELGWGYMVLARRFRTCVLAAALFFYDSIYWLMQINFWQLPVFYLIFLPWGDLLGRKSTKVPQFVSSRQRSLRWEGGLLIIGNGLCGLAHIDSWPFAVYPSFGNPPERQVMQYYLVTSDGQGIENINLESDPRLHQWLPKTRLQGLHNQLLRASDSLFYVKLTLLTPLYVRALAAPADQHYTIMLRVFDLQHNQMVRSEVVGYINPQAELE
mgnify:CR=1 FL=1